MDVVSIIIASSAGLSGGGTVHIAVVTDFHIGQDGIKRCLIAAGL